MIIAHNPNRSLIHIFCLSLTGLLLVYSTIAVYGLFALESTNATELAAGLLRIAPVKAPCSNPNNSDSSSSPGSAAQFTFMKGWLRRFERK